MVVAVLFVCLAIVYVAVNVLLVLARNYRAHQFFKTKSPDLPVLQNASPFHGHYWSLMFKAKNWKMIDDFHKSLGRSFGFYFNEQPWVATKDVDLIKLIEIDNPHKHINRAFFGVPFQQFNDSIFQIKDDQWRQMRRAMAPALTNHKIRSDEIMTSIELIVGRLAEGLEHRARQAKSETGNGSFILNIGDMAQRFTLGVIFSLTYKRDNEIDFISENDTWATHMESASQNILHPIVCLSASFPFFRPIAQFLTEFHVIGKLNSRIVDFINEATDLNRVAREQHEKVQRRSSSESADYKEKPFSALKGAPNFKRRLVDTIIDAFLEKRVQYEAYVGSVLFLLLAGFETTADTITCIIWQLSQKPQIQEKLRQAFLEGGIDADYANWVVNESLRWHPPVPLGTGRYLGEDVTVNGTFLAKGTYVMPSTYSIHHDKSVWGENADEFYPERWQDAKSFHPAAFVAFGLGPRNCIGGKLAVHEIKMMLQLVLSKYRIEKCSETFDEWNFSSPGMIYTILDKDAKVKFVPLNGETN